jgi:S-DNA-T family DNA segregation ATPase FtsK/SpoIIIE
MIPAGEEILPGSLAAGGGLFGGFILFALRKLLGQDGSVLVLIGFTLCAVLMVSTWSLMQTYLFAKKKTVDGYNSAKEAIAATKETVLSQNDALQKPWQIDGGTFYDQDKGRLFGEDFFKGGADDSSGRSFSEEPERNYWGNNKYDNNKDNNKKIEFQNLNREPQKPISTNTKRVEVEEYMLPPLSLLKKHADNLRPIKTPREISNNSLLLEQTLESFGVKAKVVNACYGPVITRYELEPALGVKVSKIVNLSDDIALKLAASGIRIEAPIPGKAALGIEVPNKQPSGVFLSEVLKSDEFQKSKSPLTVALGKDIAGNPVVADLAKMPHLLVAGSTGSGKSVCINTLISSILFKAAPNEVKFILIDPKIVELSNYNGISHLLTPVVTDAKKAAAALNWAVNEMERRYAVFATAGVRDIFRYNELNKDLFLPLIVIIIDELADLMMVAPADVEESICRLAQKARAAGIHLVLATQRPSVNVITGTIKANVPSRISFAVSSQIDSRTILDMPGAEKLLGKGDMLFYPAGAVKPLRVQGAFIGDDEIEELVLHIKDQDYQNDYTESLTHTSGEKKSEFSEKKQPYFEDELFEDAAVIVIETGQASVSMLQRRFRIGYTRAARLIDTMENMKIVGPAAGSKPRDILMSLEEFRHICNK